MAIYLDDEPLQLVGDDLSSVLSAAADHLADKGRIVVEVQLDGKTLIEDALDAQYNNTLNDAEVRLYSAYPQELAVIALEQVREKLQDARIAQSQAASLLQEDQRIQAMEQVVRVIEVWQQTQQAVLTSAQLLGIDLDKRQVKGRSIPAMTTALLEQVGGLRDLLETGDTVGLADAMAYEWPQTVDQWDEFITQLVQWIEVEFDGEKE